MNDFVIGDRVLVIVEGTDPDVGDYVVGDTGIVMDVDDQLNTVFVYLDGYDYSDNYDYADHCVVAENLRKI